LQFELSYYLMSTLGNEVEIAQHILIGLCKIIAMIELPGFLCTYGNI
jgi:hypothetical protein